MGASRNTGGGESGVGVIALAGSRAAHAVSRGWGRSWYCSGPMLPDARQLVGLDGACACARLGISSRAPRAAASLGPMEGSTPPAARAIRDFVVDAGSGPSPPLLKGRAPFVDLATPPREKEVAELAAAPEEASSSGARPAS
eukprot:15464165-Alexandrium_andersonii.AAC.1